MANTAGKKSKQLLFKLMAIALPVVLLVLVEVLLRACNYGNDLRLFIADNDCADCLVFNPAVSERYFIDRANAPIGNREPFKQQKPTGTLRLFVLGESTTLGFPYMHNGSFSRMLKYRLMLMYPQTNFEIINLSLTAVNSYTVSDIAKEVVNYSPDAVLIYTGHNEYYGALGVASTSRLGSSPFIIKSVIKLRQYRLVQLMFNGYNNIKGAFVKKVDTGKNLMERMVAKPSIPQGSALYRAGIEQYQYNMQATCEMLSRHHVPVLISSLVSNEKDLPPLDEQNCPGAGKATALYHKATQAYSHGKYAEAKKIFTQARDEDMLRFRAPAAINNKIKRLSRLYTKVYLADAEALFEHFSPHGIIDSTTLLEHVHPNLKGYALLSEAFFEALNTNRLLPGKPVRQFTLAQLLADMPVTRVDSVFGVYSVAILKQRWPFHQPIAAINAPRYTEHQLALNITKGMPWNSAMEELMTTYQRARDTINTLKVAEAVMLEYPYDASFYIMAGRVAGLTNYAKAANYLQRAFNMAPSIEIAKELYDLHMKNDKPELALFYVNYGLKQTPQNASLAVVGKQLAYIIQLKKGLYSDNKIKAKQQLAKQYSILGYPAVAGYYNSMN